MQVPEKLSLIGGSILLASTLVFTLKSQASQILPKVNNGMSEMFKNDQERQQDQQGQAFDNNFQQAQQKGWQTGQWGTAKFYVDDQKTMHVGSGQLNGPYSNVVNVNHVHTINLEESVQAPQDSSFLFSDSNSTVDFNFPPLTNINGLPNLNTSQTTNMKNMFYYDNFSKIDLTHLNTSNVTNMSNMLSGDSNLTDPNLSNFDTSHVTNMESMFNDDSNLTSLDVSNFDTHNVTNMAEMFEYNTSMKDIYGLEHFDTYSVTNIGEMFQNNYNLNNLDMSHFDTSKINDMHMLFYDSNIHQLNLGNNTKLNSIVGLTGTYQSNGQTSNLADGNAHPGTWTER